MDCGWTSSLYLFSDPTLQRIVLGIRRFQGGTQRGERLPLVRELLLRILSLFNTSVVHGATMHAAFCLAFAAFLRVGEFTYTQSDLLGADFGKFHPTRGHVTLQKDHLELTLPASKTDPFRCGITLTVAASHDAACPVKSLAHLFARAPAPASAPLFFTSALPFTRDIVINEMRAALTRLGIPGQYSGHSFRRGAATSARAAGVSDSDIQLLGRWKSDSYKLYIDTPKSHILSASRLLQQVHTPAPNISAVRGD